MISTRRRMPEKEKDKQIRRRVLGEMEVMDLDLVEVMDGRAAVEIEAVKEAAVMVEEVVAVMVVAKEVRISSATVVEKKATSALSVRRRTAFATSASKQGIFSRCAVEKSQRMAVTQEEALDGILEEASVVDLVEAHGERTNRRPGSSI